MTVEEGVLELGLGGGGEMEGFGWVVGVDFEMGDHFAGIGEEDCWGREVGEGWRGVGWKGSEEREEEERRGEREVGF